MLAYHLPVLHGLCASSERALASILSKSVKLCLGVHRSTSNAAAMAEGKVPPLQALRIQESLRHFTRLSTRHRGHPLVGAIKRRTCSRFHQAVMPYRYLLTGPRPLPMSCRPTWPLEPPPANTIVPGLACKKFVPSCVVRQLSLDLICSNEGRIQVFTDASVTSVGSSCAYVVPAL